MKKLIPVISLLAVIAPLEASSAQQLYCPNSWTIVNLGITEAQAEQLCGSPTNKTESRESVAKTYPVEQYYYTIDYGSRYTNEAFTARGAIANQQQRFNQGVDTVLGQNNSSLNVRINLVITVIEDRINNIRADNQDITSTTLCSDGIELQVGDSVSSLLQACGEPALVNRSTQSFQTGEVSDVTTWVYSGGQYQANSTFKFIDGVLAEVQ